MRKRYGDWPLPISKSLAEPAPAISALRQSFRPDRPSRDMTLSTCQPAKPTKPHIDRVNGHYLLIAGDAEYRLDLIELAMLAADAAHWLSIGVLTEVKGNIPKA